MNPVQKWVFAQRGLNPAARLLLLYYCARANGEMTCFPSYGTAAHDCELTRRFVIKATKDLCGKNGPLSIVTDPAERAAILAKAGANYNCRANVYRVNFTAGASNGEHRTPSDGEHRAPSPSANGEHRTPTKRRKGEHRTPSSYPQGEHRTPIDGEHRTPGMVNCTHADGEHRTPELLTEKRTSEPKSAPASAVTSGAGAPQPGKVLDSGGEVSDGTPPPAPPKAPTLGAQPPGAAPNQALRRPGDKPPDSDADPFRDDGGASKAFASRLLGRTVHLAANDAGRVTEDDPPQTSGDRDRRAEAAGVVTQSVAQALKMRAYPPGRFPALTRDEQHDVLMPKRPRPAYAQGDVLAAIRRAGRIPVAARP